MPTNSIIKQTENWLTTFIIEYSICPFAKRPHELGRINYCVIESTSIEHCLKAVFDQCLLLDKQEKIETTLIIYPNYFSQFSDYLDFLTMAESFLAEQNYQGIYQLASFHPQYIFEGENTMDPSNYTNRSPYPMLHLIREASLEHELKSYPHPELIPQRNIKLTRELGLEKLQIILNNSLGKTNKS